MYVTKVGRGPLFEIVELREKAVMGVLVSVVCCLLDEYFVKRKS